MSQDSRTQRVLKAVIPAAGFGTRMLPISKSVPKEMLPVGRKPMLQHVVEEAVASGLEQVCIVIREGKEVIRDYFCQPYAGDKRSVDLAELERLVAGCELVFVIQKEQRGLGDALLEAREFVGTDSFLMMIPDQLMFSTTAAAAQLIRRWRPGPTIWSSLLRLPKAERPFFPGARGVDYEERDAGELIIGRLLTEEETQRAHAGLDYEVRGFGRTIYPPEIFDYLGPEFTNPQTGEVDLLKTFERCTERLSVRGTWLEGEPFDMGTFEGYYRYLPRFLKLTKAARVESQKREGS